MVTTITILAIALAIAVIVGIYLYKSKNALKQVYDSATKAWRTERDGLKVQVRDLETGFARERTERIRQNTDWSSTLENVKKQHQETIQSLEHSRDGWKGKFTQVDKRNKELTKELEQVNSVLEANNQMFIKADQTIADLRKQNKKLSFEKAQLEKELAEKEASHPHEDAPTPEAESPEESPAEESPDSDNTPADNVTATANPEDVEWVNSEAAPAPYGVTAQKQVQEQERAQDSTPAEQVPNEEPTLGDSHEHEQKEPQVIQEPTPVTMPPIPPYPAENKLPKRFRKKGKKHGKSVKTLPQE